MGPPTAQSRAMVNLLMIGGARRPYWLVFACVSSALLSTKLLSEYSPASSSSRAWPSCADHALAHDAAHATAQEVADNKREGRSPEGSYGGVASTQFCAPNLAGGRQGDFIDELDESWVEVGRGGQPGWPARTDGCPARELGWE